MISNAAVFKPKKFTAQKEFEFILIQITKCYKLMLNDYTSIKNDENIIRNHLHKDYLDNHEIIERLKLHTYFFDIEIPSLSDDFKETGRTDIKVYNAIERIRNRQSPYFIIECKRLDGINTGKGSLNWKYVENGICRFTKREDYPSYHGINGMIGFIVKSINISKLVDAINILLSEDEKLIKMSIANDFDSSYISKHIDSQEKVIELYHLMFDYSLLIGN
jgi:hypothetical protein